MSADLISTFSDIIDDKFKLANDGGYWKIEESAITATNRKLLIGGIKGFGFSLDIEKQQPWGFFKPNPPKGIASVCDGIIIFLHENKTYIVILDLKSTNEGKATKQILSTKYLCEWLCQLIALHCKINSVPTTIGLICKQKRNGRKQRRQPQKGKTRLALSITKCKQHAGFKVLTVEDQQKIALRDLVKACI